MRQGAEKPMVVAIDGPCGVGKSSLARDAARNLGYTHLDSGALYRAATWHCLRHGIDFADPDALAACVRDGRPQIVEADDGMRVTVRGEDVTEHIREPDVSRFTAFVADVRAIREMINDVQRRFAGGRCVVVDGRDIATVVFPDADVKIYLDADLAERGRRRFLQQTRDGRPRQTLEEVIHDIEERDRRDSSRPFGPLRRHPDAVVVDSTRLTYDSTLAELERIIRGGEAGAGPSEGCAGGAGMGRGTATPTSAR